MAVDLLVNPFEFYSYTKLIRGWDYLEVIPHSWKLNIATKVIRKWSENWPDGQSFGDSDETYMIQEYLNELVSFLKTNFDSNTELEVGFFDYLQIREKQ